MVERVLIGHVVRGQERAGRFGHFRDSFLWIDLRWVMVMSIRCKERALIR